MLDHNNGRIAPRLTDCRLCLASQATKPLIADHARRPQRQRVLGPAHGPPTAAHPLHEVGELGHVRPTPGVTSVAAEVAHCAVKDDAAHHGVDGWPRRPRPRFRPQRPEDRGCNPSRSRPVRRGRRPSAPRVSASPWSLPGRRPRSLAGRRRQHARTRRGAAGTPRRRVPPTPPPGWMPAPTPTQRSTGPSPIT
jgi:hypothetical protein